MLVLYLHLIAANIKVKQELIKQVFASQIKKVLNCQYDVNLRNSNMHFEY